MKPTFLAVLLLTFLCPAVQAHEIGNGADQLKLLFQGAKVRAREELRGVLHCSFESWVTPGLRDWILLHKEDIANDIELSPHFWPDVAAQPTCASTIAGELGGKITFSYKRCAEKPLDSNLAFAILVHESAHHLGIRDEEEADRIAQAVSGAFQADQCAPDGTPARESNVGKLSKDGSVSGSGTFWDLRRGIIVSKFPTMYSRDDFGFSPDNTLYLKTNYTGTELIEFGVFTGKTRVYPVPDELRFSQVDSMAWSQDQSLVAFIASRERGPLDLGLYILDRKFGTFKRVETGGRAILSFIGSTKRLALVLRSHDTDQSYLTDGTENQCLLAEYDVERDRLIERFRFLSPLGDAKPWRCSEQHFTQQGRFLSTFLEYIKPLPVTGMNGLGSHWMLWDVESGRLVKTQDLGYIGPSYFIYSSAERDARSLPGSDILATQHIRKYENGGYSETTGLMLIRTQGGGSIVELKKGIHFNERIGAQYRFSPNDRKLLINTVDPVTRLATLIRVIDLETLEVEREWALPRDPSIPGEAGSDLNFGMDRDHVVRVHYQGKLYVLR